VRQRAEAQKLIAAGLQPVTSTVQCKVDVAALRRYVLTAGPEADVMQAARPRRQRAAGTLRDTARSFCDRMGSATEVTVSYRYAELGAALVAAGFVTASREYAVNGRTDPFTSLPRQLRAVAFRGTGFDLDDSASFPRLGLATFRTGAAEARQFLDGSNREVILQAVGSHFFGVGNTDSERSARRKMAKRLFNSLQAARDAQLHTEELSPSAMLPLVIAAAARLPQRTVR